MERGLVAGSPSRSPPFFAPRCCSSGRHHFRSTTTRKCCPRRMASRELPCWEQSSRSASQRSRFGRAGGTARKKIASARSEEHTSELQSQSNLVCRLLLEKKKTHPTHQYR